MNEQVIDSEVPEPAAGPVLSTAEARVLGALMEKQRTTPDYYPMTLKGLVQACNQKTSRNPVMNLSEGEVGHTLNQLRDRKLVLAAFSGRAERYEQRLSKALDLDRQEQALLCVLLLRGSQTLGELRSNASRMALFDDLAAVNLVLEQLMTREPPLVKRLSRAVGRREERYLQLLCADQEPAVSPPMSEGGEDSRIDSLQQEVKQLRAELDTLWQLTGLQKPGADPGAN